MKKTITSILLFFHLFTFTQNKSNWFSQINESQVVITGQRYIVPSVYRVIQVNLLALQSELLNAPTENLNGPTPTSIRLSIPMPDGSHQLFNIYESPIMDPALAATFPSIKTYGGWGEDDPTASIRLDITPQGFHSMILSAKGSYFIDPYCSGNTQHYIVYNKIDYQNTQKQFECHYTDPTNLPQSPNPNNQPILKSPIINNTFSTQGSAKAIIGDCKKRTYRLALAATGEYTTFHGGTVALATAAQVTTMNRVNGVYERELAVRLNIISNNNLLIYTNASTDPYTNGTPGTMINENQTNVTNVIGSANYDIGHVFGTNSGGLAGLGVVCSSGNKARGVTGSGAPVGDPFDIDYVAHEMGHQFGGNHTFNGTTGSCSGNGVASARYEPGSGTTIMAYAGICGAQNVQSNSDDYFHVHSLLEMHSFITAGGNSCAVQTILSNTSPTITSTSGNKTIPISTPFMLTATASDPDAGQQLTYCWEQYNNESSTQPPVATATGGPNFRSFDPDTSGTRYFPRLQTLVPNATATWEVLPSVSRTMNFQVTVRDNAPGAGCNDRQNLNVTFSAAAGPFTVTYPTATGISWQVGSSQTVTWNRANTHLSPVNCSHVDIYLSTDGGYKYPITLASNVPNIGSYNIIVPNNVTTSARVMVKARGNIFFDISNNNFSIVNNTTQNYSFTTTDVSDSVCSPANATYTLNIGSVNGYTGNVTLAAAGLPGSATATFSTNPVTPTGTSTVTIGNIASVSAGTYLFNVNANASAGNKTIVLQLVVSAAPSITNLLSPANNFNGASTTPILRWATATSAISYQVQVATDTAFNNIVATAVVTDTTYTVSPTLNVSTTYYWRVIANSSCGINSTSARFTFKTGIVVCTVYNSTDVPKTISSSGTPTVNSTLNIPINSTVQDINVSNLVGTHSYIQDLTFQLISPATTNVTLMQNVCASQNDFNIKFDDEATNNYANIPCPPTGGGTYKPLNLLSAFDGQATNGTWTMRISDNQNGDGGSLTAWGLNVCYYEACNLTAVASSTASSCSSPCNGTATVTPSSGTIPYSYVWSNAATTASLSAICPGSYSVTVTDAKGCTALASTTVASSGGGTVTPSVSIATPSTTICTGASITFTATPVNGGATPSYQWKVNGTNAGTNSPTFTSTTLANNDIVTCVMTSSASCASPTTATSNAITITVNATVTPSVSIATPSTTICTGASITFTATPVNGGATPSYQWKVNGTNVGTNSPTFTTTTLANNDIVTCVMTSSASCASPTTATSNAITITVNATVTPSVSIATPSTTICTGASITFTATPVNGGATPSYQWKVNGTNAGTNSPTFTSTTLTNNAVVTCVMTSSASCASPTTATSNAITITVNATVTPSVSIATPSTTICTGASITFTATPVNGGATPSYQWKINGTNVGTNSPTFTTTTLTNNAVVSCVMTSSASCSSPTTATSNAITITVNATVTPSVSIATPSTTICTGASITFTATPVNGGATPSYQWKVNGTNVGTNSPTFTSTTLANNDIVTCVMTSSASCATPTTATSNAITITVNAAVTPSVSIATPSTTICTGASITFTATPVNGGATPSYQWKVNGTNVGTNSPTFTSTTLANNDIVTCVMTSSASCASPTTATSNAITITVNAAVTPSVSIATPSTTICTGASITFTATPVNGGATPSYQWKVNGTNVGTNSPTFTSTTLANNDIVTCVMTSSASCASPTTATSNAITITVNPVLIPAVTITSSSNNICYGENILFTAIIVNGGAIPIYQWKLNGVDVGINGPTFSSNSLNNNDQLTCEVTSSEECASPATVVSSALTVNVKPTPATPEINSNSPVCQGYDILLSSPFVSGATYSWSGPGGFNSTQQDNTIANSQSQQSGNYTLVVTVDGCPSQSATATITVNAVPIQPTITLSGTILSSSSPINNQWYVNNNLINGATTQNYQATIDGWYVVKVTNAEGCSTVSDSVYVKITGLSEPSEFSVQILPNPFTDEIVINSETDNLILTIRDDIGRLILSETISNTKHIIFTHNWAQGIYIVEIAKNRNKKNYKLLKK